jgi:hypothetical protein
VAFTLRETCGVKPARWSTDEERADADNRASRDNLRAWHTPFNLAWAGKVVAEL